MLVSLNGKVTIEPAPPVIGSKHQPGNAVHYVDGTYWERYPHVDARLQAFLLEVKMNKPSTIKVETQIHPDCI